MPARISNDTHCGGARGCIVLGFNFNALSTLGGGGVAAAHGILYSYDSYD